MTWFYYLSIAIAAEQILPIHTASENQEEGIPRMNPHQFLRTDVALRSNTNLHSALIIPRILVGAVFLSEGLQKFLFSESLGVGRFIKIGIPAPEVMAPFVGLVEILCGILLLSGLLTRLAAIPLLIDMLVAIATTKIPILMEKGFWAMAHEARTDWSMILTLLFLLIAGPGRLSLDYYFRSRKAGMGDAKPGEG